MAERRLPTKTVKPVTEQAGDILKLPEETGQLLDAIAGKETAQRLCQWPSQREQSEAEYQERIEFLRQQAEMLTKSEKKGGNS